VPDPEHDGFDDPGPQHQYAADQRDRTQPGGAAAGDEDGTPNHKYRRDDPEEPRVFDGYIAF
jgi:hypothetical protein